jgi:hypothetical protein
MIFHVGSNNSLQATDRKGLRTNLALARFGA